MSQKSQNSDASHKIQTQESNGQKGPSQEQLREASQQNSQTPSNHENSQSEDNNATLYRVEPFSRRTITVEVQNPTSQPISVVIVALNSQLSETQ